MSAWESKHARLFTLNQLPQGFLYLLDDPPPTPPPPRPSATLVLLRGGGPGLEVLLLKRSHRSRFIPGAWVFPGGTLDPGDDDPAIRRLAEETSPPSQILDGTSESDSSERPPLRFRVAALRETFEETGILVTPTGQVEEDGTEARARSQLLAGEISFPEALNALDANPDFQGVTYSGHWLTPECEPRRYDTRFFTVEVPPRTRAMPHAKELVEAIWISPGEALARNRGGTLPLVPPTFFALEELVPFGSPSGALEYLRSRPVVRHLPVPQRVSEGVLFHL